MPIILPPSHILSDPNEIKAVDNMLAIVLRNDLLAQSIKRKMSNSLSNYSSNQVYRLTAGNEHLMNFCRQLIDTQATWSEKFLSGKFLSHAIQTLDGGNMMVYDILMGASLYSRAIDSDVDRKYKMSLINEACKWNNYNALILRCETKISLLENIVLSTDDKKVNQKSEALEQILVDIISLSNTYWGIGYARAGCILNQLATLYNKLAASLIKTNPEECKKLKTQADNFSEQSIKNFLIAFYLEDNPQSKIIMNDITQNKGILSMLSNANQFSDWTAAKIKFQEWITREAYAKVEREAKSEITKLLAVFNAAVKPSTANAESSASSSSILQRNSLFNRPLTEVSKEINEKLTPTI
ncbi:MAG: hypothetical protein P4M12_03625 [Gammaproteobacteria bacterium]|nr:hypothetical protein [Gammaproteobacteria bacterium]